MNNFRKRSRCALSLLVALCLLIVSLPITVSAVTDSESESPEYLTWSQSDERWGNKVISKKTMSKVGCLVTALAKLMVHSGQRDPELFDPGVCLDELKSCGIFKGNNDNMYMGLLDTDYFPTYAPELIDVINSGTFSSAWSESKAVSEISDFIKNGYYVVVMTNTTRGTTHWLCVDDVRDGKLYVMDNSKVCDLYSRSDYKGVWRYMLVKYSGEKEYPAYSGIERPSNPSEQTRPEAIEIYSAPSELRVRTEANLSSSTVRYLDLGEQVYIDKFDEADGYVWGHLTGGGWCAVSICTYVSGSVNFIEYDVGSASFATKWQQKPYGQTVAIIEDVPTLEGYTFLGWSTDISAVEVEYMPCDTVNVSGDLTLYPVWKVGSTEPEVLPDRVERYITPDDLRVRTKPTTSNSDVVGYKSEGDIVSIDRVEFDGKYTWGHLIDDSGWVAISLCSYLDGSLYFVFFDCDIKPAYQANPHLVPIELRTDTPKTAGKQFVGWSTEENSDNVDYLPGQTIDQNADVTLYPVWSDGCEHRYETSTVDPTDLSCGYTLSTCTLCGDEKKSDFIDSLGKLTELNGLLTYEIELADAAVSIDSVKGFQINGAEISSDRIVADITAGDGRSRVILKIVGVDADKGERVALSVKIGERECSGELTVEKKLLGYSDVSVSSYGTLCNITLVTDADLSLGDSYKATGANGKEYTFIVDYVSGDVCVLSCESFDADENLISFSEIGLSVITEGSRENVKKPACSSDAYFTPYCQVRQNADDPDKFDLRIVFVADLEKLENVDKADVEIIFTKNSSTVRKVVGTLGGQDGNYLLYKSLTAAGDIYVADDGYGIFGQEMVAIPKDAFDSFTLRITDKLTGALLLETSMK